MNSIKSYLVTCLFLLSLNTFATEYHVAKTGDDSNKGTLNNPFLTIQKAANIALAGDVITVHQGVYREWVKPSQGGYNNLQRITYRAAKNEEVWIKGSEEIKGWKKVKKGIWKITLDNKMFGDFNPYQEIVRGDWLRNVYGRDHHLGEIYLNGKALYENSSLELIYKETPLERAEDQEGSKYQWYCESNQNTTTIYANFSQLNPNNQLVEINVRPAVFYPEKTGLNYITVRGFNLCHAATQWAPPTAEQPGLIGPNWSKGWIIENNLITDSKCAAISLGKERGSGHLMWVSDRSKSGTQHEREAVFRALQLGWSKENIGSHIVRNNTIKDCEQGGIIGHMGGAFSEIYNNHIFNIHVKRQFTGFEIAGIKLHAAIDVIIKNNCIHNNYRGIWLDWQAQGAQVSANVLFNHPLREDLFIEVNHGPMIIDHNIMLSKSAIVNASQGSAFVNNLIAGSIQLRPAYNRFTHYHFPHSTQVLGMQTIILGDDRFYNNIFASNGTFQNKNTFQGLNAYNDFPLVNYQWKRMKLDDYNRQKFPVFIDSNLYLNKSTPYKSEINFIENRSLKPEISLEEKEDGFYLNITIDESFFKVKTTIVNTDILGFAFQSETPFENRDGTPISLANDYFGKTKANNDLNIGPFSHLKIGKNQLKVFSK